MSGSEHKKNSRREFITQILASGATVQTGLWSSLLGALTTVAADEADAQIQTHSFWKKKSTNPYYGWGMNSYGNLGLGTTSNVSSPTNINLSPTKMAAGSAFALALTADGKLYSTGSNISGQLGLNLSTATTKSSFTQITSGAGSWTQVAAGDNFGMAVDTNGYLWTFGRNSYGQLGINLTADKSSPVQLAGTTVWSKIAGGMFHAAGITSTGALFCWGANYYGQLGNNNAGNAVKSPIQILAGTSFSQIACGNDYSVAILANGLLYGWGYGVYNLGWDGTYWSTDYFVDEFGSSPTQIRNISGSFTQVSAGASHALAIKTDGKLYAWGNASHGQFGTINKIMASPNQLTGSFTMLPGSMTGIHTMILTTTNFRCAGTNYYGEYGNNSSNGWNWSLANSNIGTNWSQFSLGRHFTLAIDSSAKLWSWGHSNYGALGNNSYTAYSSPVQVWAVGTNSWSQVCAGVWHGVGIQSDGSLWAWGANSDGQNGSASETTVPTKIGTSSWAQVAAGGWHNLMIDAAGNMFGLGYNNGTLGNNNTINQSSPVQVTVAGPWKQAAGGYEHSLAIKTDGSLWATGDNGFGQVGDGTFTSRKVFTKIGSDSWTQVAAASYSSAGIKIDGTLWAWGSNMFGTVGHTYAPWGIGSPVQIQGSWSQVVGGYDMFLGKKTDGTYWSWGGNRCGTLGLGINNQSPTQVLGSWSQIFAGNGFSAAVKTDSTLWVWGTNTQGELGLGDTTFRSSPTQIPGSWTLIPGDFKGQTAGVVFAKKLS